MLSVPQYLFSSLIFLTFNWYGQVTMFWSLASKCNFQEELFTFSPSPAGWDVVVSHLEHYGENTSGMVEGHGDAGTRMKMSRSLTPWSCQISTGHLIL